MVEVTNCFGVPHHESAGEVKLGQDYHRSMCKYLNRINDKEKIVGWWVTDGGSSSFSMDCRRDRMMY